MLSKVWNFFLDSLQTLVFALALFALTYFFIAQPNKVKGRSMMSSFHNYDLILTEKISYRLHPPRRGDVVIFRAPPSEACAIDQCEYIKRVIGLPGETIELHQGHVYINGRVLAEKYLDRGISTGPESFLKNDQPYHIPTGSYMLLGDNRPYSRDSRAFGPIKKEAIIGKAIFRYWPPSRLGIIPNPRY